ncbi:helix-turn-helix domain-containing protein [Streptomyces sp. NPDC051310]|uniref:helix-turn-helix domain-containing protein n=1 Tax=Streptomyces sp. NPDC051310 TaxID=3365649 RepID=UPI0037A681C9
MQCVCRRGGPPVTQSTSTRSAPPLPSPKERRRLREARSMSESQVAEVLGVTRATVRSWETGRASPRGRKREAYLKLLKAHEAAAPTPPATRKPPPKAKTRPSAAAAPDASTPQGKGREEPARKKPRKDQGQERPREQEQPPEQPQPSEPDQSPEPDREEAGAPARPGAQEQGDTEDPAEAQEEAGSEDPAEARGRAPSGEPSGGPVAEPCDEPPGEPSDEPSDEPAQAEQAQAEHAQAEQAQGEQEPKTELAEQAAPRPLPQARKTVRPGTPAGAFDALYGRTAPVLVQQAYLLTGRRRLAREAVEHAFHHAWERWPRVAVDRDPAGWVRAAAHEYALSPWHRMRRTHRHPDPPTTDRAARALRGAVLDLPPPYRRALLLYDGLGFDLPDTAAELEASTPAAAYRVLHARAAVAERLPELSDPEALHERLAGLLTHGPAMVLATARTVRTRSERRARGWTRAALGLTAVIIGATAFTLTTAPTRYEPPLAPGMAISGVPVLSGPQRLTPQDEQLRDALRARPFTGPPRLLPDTR